jgi:ferredoxin-nitrate reductase
MNAIVARSTQVLEERGSGAFGFSNSGQLFLEDYYTLAVMTKAGLGRPHVDGNTRLCTATAAAALKTTAPQALTSSSRPG